MIITNNQGVTQDTEEVVPHVGMAGLFLLKAPYTALIRESVEYTVTSVISIAGAIANEEDPLTDVYLANGDTEENYALDQAANHCIITIQSGVGDTIVIPNSALIAVPNADGVKYANVIMGISLSAVPDDLDLTAIKTEIEDLVFGNLGVRSTAFATTLAGTTIITHEQHAAVEAARIANIESGLSVRTRNAQLEAENTALKAQMTVLENFIKAGLAP